MAEYVDYTDPAYPWLEGVQIISVGMNWPASTGDYTATFEQLADIVTAANEDPLVLPPRVKLGHRSEVNGELLIVNPFEEIGDAAPAFGRFVNLRTIHGGSVLVGDMVEVPEWLAIAMPSAFPSRSAEPWLHHTTPGGKTYAAILTAVSLLGEYMPAIQDLDDLQRFVEGGPDAVAASTREARVPATAEPELSIDAGVISDRFDFGWAVDPANAWEDDNGNIIDPYWAWAISVRVDPLEVIFRLGSDLYRLPFTTDGEDHVEWGEPERVREVYVPVNATHEEMELLGTAPVRDGQRVLASNLPRRPKPARPAASRPDPNTPTTEEVTMSDNIDVAALRDRLGLTAEQLPDDATPEQINEALAAEPANPTPEGGNGEVEEAPAAEQPEGEPVAASAGLPDGMIAVPREQWEQVQAGAQAGAQLSTEAEEARRDRTIEAALDVGKVGPAQRESLLNLHERNRDAFYTLLTAAVEDGGLAEGLVPVAPKGRDSEVSASTQEATQAYIDRHFPRASRQRAVRHRQEA